MAEKKLIPRALSQNLQERLPRVEPSALRAAIQPVSSYRATVLTFLKTHPSTPGDTELTSVSKFFADFTCSRVVAPWQQELGEKWPIMFSLKICSNRLRNALKSFVLRHFFIHQTISAYCFPNLLLLTGRSPPLLGLDSSVRRGHVFGIPKGYGTK